MLQDKKVQWITAEDGKEYLVIPKELIKQITDMMQGAKVIETLPVWED